ncbi:MAG: hypothetical protein P8X46_05595 [Nitrospirales bacterium]
MAEANLSVVRVVTLIQTIHATSGSGLSVRWPTKEARKTLTPNI